MCRECLKIFVNILRKGYVRLWGSQSASGSHAPRATHTLNRAAPALRCAAVVLLLHSEFWTSKLCNNQYHLGELLWLCGETSIVGWLIMECDSTVGPEQDGGQNIHESIDVSQRYEQSSVSNCIHIYPDKSAMMRAKDADSWAPRTTEPWELGLRRPTHPKQRPAEGLRSCAWQQPPRAGRVVD